jgi:hypothetical protein
MKIATIPIKWIAAIEFSLSARRLIELREQVDHLGIDHGDLAAIRALWDRLRQAESDETA